MNRGLRFKKIVLFFVFLVCIPQTSAWGADIVVVQSAGIVPYNRVVQGFENTILHDIPTRGPKGIQAHTITSHVLSEEESLSTLRRRIISRHPDLLIVIGSSSLSLVKGITDIPIIYLMVPFPDLLVGKQNNITGININITVQQQLEALRRAVPRIRSIGLLYDPQRTGKIVKEAQTYAAAHDLSLITLPVKKSSEVPGRLAELKGKIDWFWMLPDLTVLTPQTIDSIMLFSLENWVPILTFSKKYLDMGAVLSVSFSAKVFIYLLGTIILLTCTFNYISFQSQKKNFKKEIIKDGTTLSRVLADNVRLGIFAGSNLQVEAALQTTLGMEGVIGTCAYNRDGTLLNRETSPRWELTGICRIEENELPDFSVLRKNAQKVFQVEDTGSVEIWRPVLSKANEFSEDELYYDDSVKDRPDSVNLIGYVGVVFDKGLVRKSIHDMMVKNILILIFFLFLGSAAAYYIVQGVTRPLNLLIGKIKAQKLDVEAGNKDDLGMLSDTFSHVVKTLNNSFDTINNLKLGLENKVDELELEIRKRRETEEALLESEDKFRSISEGIADGVAIVRNGKIVWLNKAFSTIFGRSLEELLGTEAEMLLNGDRGKSGGRLLQDCCAGYENQDRSLLEARKKNGQQIHIEVSARNIAFENQDAIQLIIRDMTRGVRAEKKKKEMEIKALAQAKMADLGKIATGVAHEINQPLSYIKIAYESARRDMENGQFDEKEMNDCFAEALRQVDRITMITDHLRSFGRSDSSLLVETRMPDILDGSLSLMGEVLRLADITLSRDIARDLPTVFGNSVQLEQVFINLLQNSIDALAESDEKKIFITMQSKGEKVEISFSDTGPGISIGVLDTVFDPFFTTKTLKDRTGLGLAIVAAILKEHHGSIEYRNRPEGGAHFIIMLPVYDRPVYGGGEDLVSRRL